MAAGGACKQDGDRELAQSSTPACRAMGRAVMRFAKVEPQVDFPAQERAVLQFWERTRAFERLWQRQRELNLPRWSFLDGPITANNPMGVHHAWGRTYKDVFQRYFAMTGHQLRYQNGFDCQGLWVEVEVEKELQLRSKQDIENLVPGDRFASIEKFVNLCKQRVDRFARIQTQQSIRLGMWMDWDRTDEDWARPPGQRHSYFTMSEENNYTIWSFLKKCHSRGLIYRAYDAMPWCPRCAVGISQMEMHEGYQLVAHRAVFVRFPLRGRPGENLLVWTTTPWTLSSNVAAAVNPDLTYLKLEHAGQIYYVAKGALTAQRLEEEFRRGHWVPGVPKLKPLAQHLKERGGYTVVGEIRGAEMLGWTYDGPWDELPAQGHAYGYPSEIAQVVQKQGWARPHSARQAHRVIAWDAVGETEGTGIVHIAPGCGQEDFELGKREKLPPVAPLSDEGVFLPGFGPLSGRSALDPSTTELILDHLRNRGLLVATELYPHNYPHCWRCKTELLFRLVDEWYISMSWREEIMRVCYDITWIPEDGLKRELDWLRNMGDWMISKKRYWGLALPIWVDEETGEFDVIGSREELQQRAAEGWELFEGHTPHRPWVDQVKIRNPKTGNLMSRIPDVGNPWLDAGIVPFSTMKYNTDRNYWEQWFPADLVTESFPGQFRNWFYALLAMSTMMTWPRPRAPFKTLFGYALVRDQYGQEMHKSLGNAIPFEGAADTGYVIRDKTGKEQHCPPMSADLMRWLYCRSNPVHNINFGPGPAEEVRNKFTAKLWNTYAFFCNYARLDGFDPAAAPIPLGQRPDLDRWILSDLQLLIQTARREFPRYNVMAFCLEAEEFVDDKLSNWYVRRSRRRFWKSEPGPDKLAAYQTLYTVLVTLSKLFAPISPFLCEVMYQNLTGRGEAIWQPDPQADACADSVHHCPYPEPEPSWIDADLSADMKALLRLVSLGSAARNTVKIKVRQPLAELRVQPGDERDRRAVQRFADQICDELNIKRVVLHDPAQGPLAQPRVTLNLKTAGPRLGPRLGEVQAALASQEPQLLAAKLRQGHGLELATASGPVVLAPEEVAVAWQAPEGWTAVEDRGTLLLLDVRISEALKLEGLAREVVRCIQNLRKEAGLELEDRIALYLHSPSEQLRAAIRCHQDYIAGETLTACWSSTSLGPDARVQEAKIEGQPLRVELRKV
jgi:isoleucyl-tRNA synthetase